MTLWFVTPAFKRYDLTAVCLEQRRRVIVELAGHGIEASCVVIADDENLDIARGLGFDTVEQNNDWLGRRFNDGMEYAARQGADFIVPIGSDSWIDPAYFLPRPSATETRTSRLYAVVEAHRLAECRVATPSGAGPYVFARNLLAGSGFRPAEDELRKGIDGSTIRGIGRQIPWAHRELHPLQYVGFRGEPHITRYARLWSKWGVRQRHDPWAALTSVYPADLVQAARRALSVAVAA